MVCHAGKRKAQSTSLVMLVDVVPLRHYGNKLPGDVIIQKPAARGDLSIENHRARDGVGAQANFIIAKLAVADGALPVPPPVERKHCPGGSPIGGQKFKKAEPNRSRKCPMMLGISA